MAEDQIPVRRSERAGGFHEAALLERERLAAHDARIRDPPADAEHEDQVHEARPEDGEEGDAEQEHGKGELDLAEPHEEIVGPAAAVAGPEPDGHPQDRRHHHGGEPDPQRDARAMEEPAQDIAAQGIGAEGMCPVPAVEPHGRGQPTEQVILHGVPGGQDGRQEGGPQRRDEHEQAEDGRAVTTQPLRRAGPRHQESRTRGSTTA